MLISHPACQLYPSPCFLPSGLLLSFITWEVICPEHMGSLVSSCASLPNPTLLFNLTFPVLKFIQPFSLFILSSNTQKFSQTLSPTCTLLPIYLLLIQFISTFFTLASVATSFHLLLIYFRVRCYSSPLPPPFPAFLLSFIPSIPGLSV